MASSSTSMPVPSDSSSPSREKPLRDQDTPPQSPAKKPRMQHFPLDQDSLSSDEINVTPRPLPENHSPDSKRRKMAEAVTDQDCPWNDDGPSPVIPPYEYNPDSGSPEHTQSSEARRTRQRVHKALAIFETHPSYEILSQQCSTPSLSPFSACCFNTRGGFAAKDPLAHRKWKFFCHTGAKVQHCFSVGHAQCRL